MSSPSLRSRPMPSRAPRRAATDLRAPFFCRLDRDPSAHTARAGTAVLDLEDSVAPGRKVAQRRAIAAALARPLPEDVRVLVRCHGVRESEELTRDLDASGVEALTGFVLPMVTDPDEVRAFDAQLQRLEERRGLAAGRFEVHLLIEQPAALLALEELARSSTRVASLMFGREDFMACLPLASGAAAAQAERRLPLVAAALGLPAVASPYCDVCDLPAFERYARRARDLGYQGVLTVHPAQRAVAERVFTPSAREQRAARKVLASDPGVPVRLNDGRLVGPPMRRRARGLLEACDADGRASAPSPARGPARRGRLPRYGLDTARARIGDVLDGPHVLTVDESLRSRWASHFPTCDAVLSSTPAARSVGLPARPLPASLLANLCLCLSVEPLSQTCRYHLGLRDARQLRPVEIGDTLRVRIRVEAMRNTSSGDAAVVVTTHALVNQRDEAVYVLTKDSYYDAVPGLEDRLPRARDGASHAMFDAALAAPALQRARRGAGAAAFLPDSQPVEAGEVMLHPMVRPIGWSENLELTTLVRNTHPVHFDAQRYGRDGIVVCGGFVQALVEGIASQELRQVVEERLVRSCHVATVAPEDRVGAVSRVLGVRDVGAGIEEVTVSTLGLRDLDVARELVDVELPDALFDPDPVPPAALRALCARECPELEGRVVVRVVRVLRRLKPVPPKWLE